MKTEEVKPFDEVSDLRLGRREGETKLAAQEIINKRQSLFSLGQVAAQDHEIIGIAHEAQARLCQGVVEQVEDNIRQERRNDPALRSARSGGEKSAPIHDASGEKPTDDAQDIAVCHAFGDTIEDQVMGDVIEESLNISINDPFETCGMSRANSLNRLMSTTTRTEAKRELREMRLKDGFEKSTNDFLSDPVSDGGDAQRTKFAFPFRDVDPAQRGGAVATFVFEIEHQVDKIVVETGFKCTDANFINPSSAAITLNSLKGLAHTVKVNTSS
jgi:hypothetical protein